MCISLRWKRKCDLEQLDDPIEKTLENRMKLCYLEGKKKKSGRGAIVSVLFSEEAVEAIRILIQHRGSLGIHKGNEYIFASGELHLKGWDTLQGITKQIANLKKPHLITPTRTRKFLATMLQLLDMNDAELTWITNHFGHSRDVHFAWYRKEESTVELTKMAKLLVAVDEGKKVKNQKIDNVLDTSEANDVSDTEHKHPSEITDSTEACTSRATHTETKNTKNSVKGTFFKFFVVVRDLLPKRKRPG